MPSLAKLCILEKAREKTKLRGVEADEDWGHGVWGGLHSRSGEHYVLTPDGALRAFTIKRRLFEDKWNRETVQAVNVGDSANKLTIIIH